MAKILGGFVGIVDALVAMLTIGSRFADGPLVEMLPGGPLTSGELVENGPSDWSFAADHMYVELESDGRSRKTYILTADGDAYVPASLTFPSFKTWHKAALEKPGGSRPNRGKALSPPTTQG